MAALAQVLPADAEIKEPVEESLSVKVETIQRDFIRKVVRAAVALMPFFTMCSRNSSTSRP